MPELWHIRGLSAAPPVTTGLAFDYGQDNCFIDVIVRQQGVGTQIFKNIKNDPPNYTETSIAVARARTSGPSPTPSSSAAWSTAREQHPARMYLDFFGDGAYGEPGQNPDRGADLVLLARVHLAARTSPGSIAPEWADLDTSGRVDVVVGPSWTNWPATSRRCRSAAERPGVAGA